MPLPGTRVIHPAFQAHHAPVAEGGMSARVDLYDPADLGTSTYDRATGQTVVTPAPPAFANVPARIQSLARGEGPDVADAVAEDVSMPAYLVAVPYQLRADEGWVVRVRSCPDDAMLAAGRRLIVRRVGMGTERFQRDLICEDE